jgi:hypothetical protein
MPMMGGALGGGLGGGLRGGFGLTNDNKTLFSDVYDRAKRGEFIRKMSFFVPFEILG